MCHFYQIPLIFVVVFSTHFNFWENASLGGRNGISGVGNAHLGGRNGILCYLCDCNTSKILSWKSEQKKWAN